MDEKGATQIFRALVATDSGEVPGGSPLSARPLYLIVVDGGIPGAMHRLSPGGNRLGRAHESGVQFSDPGVSRRHATLVADAHGDVWLTDAGSTNGTFLNGSRLDPFTPERVRDGDRLRFGSTVVVKFVRLDPCDERFQRELFERTVRDPLTGLYNRAFFQDRIGELAERAEARGLGLAVLMLDVDHFKRVNDTHGHDAGDAVLREVGAVLREATRAEDLVARYGGEEFVAALPVSAPDQATERAERVRAALASRRIAAAGVAGTLRVTASVGLAFAYPGRFRSASVLIGVADHGLYQAKHAGRNRVVFRTEPEAVPKTTADLYTPPSVGG